MNRKKFFPLFLAAGMFFFSSGLWGKETQSKVLLPPEIGYKNLRTALSFARSFYKKGEYEKGFELFRKCSEVKHLTDLHRAECLWYAGLCAEKANDFERAKEYYQKTLQYKGGKFCSNAAKGLKNLARAKNIFPDSSFEKGSSGPWNRMIDQNYVAEESWVRDNAAAFHGKYSLRSTGNSPLELMTEGSCSPGIFSVYMKSDAPGAKVRIEFFSYNRFAPMRLAGKEYVLSDTWQRLRLNLPKKYLKFENGTAPLFCRITPLSKNTLWADCVQIEEGGLTPWRDYAPKTYSLEEGRNLLVPDRSFVTVREAERSPAAPLLDGEWAFQVSYPVKAAKVPVEMALPLPQGKWFGTGQMHVVDGTGKVYPVQSRVLSRWPQDGSCRSVLFSFEADLQKGENPFVVKKGEGVKVHIPRRAPLEFTMSAADSCGVEYVSEKVIPVVEYSGKLYTCYLFRGGLVRGSRFFASYEVRQKVWNLSGRVEISALIRNPGSSMMVLKNAALQIERNRAGKPGLYQQYFNVQKKRFAHAPDGKCGFVQSAGGTLLMREASLRHPVKLEAHEKGRFTAHLWSDDLKSLILSRKTVLHREYVFTAANGKDVPDSLGYRSVGMAKPEYFARSRFFILPTGFLRQDQPHFKKSMGDYGFFFSGEAERVFNYAGRYLHGLFNYGDVYGDGGWGNLESYLDFAELIYSVSMNEPKAFKWALNRAKHYRDMDIAGGIACYHSSNHSGGFGYDFSHSWPQGVLYHYLLTGDFRTLDVIREVIANYMSRPIDDKYIQGSRSLGRYLLGLADFYGFTGDERIARRFMEQIRFTEKNELKPNRKDQTLFRWHGRLDPFHVWYGCCAMMEMYLLTKDKAILPAFHREIQNSLNPDFYRNDLAQLYPGAPFAETLPIHAGLLSCHRGALFYPLMKFYSELTNDGKYLRLAQLAAYAAFLPGNTKAWPMDAMRLAVLEGTSEKELLKEVFALQKKAAARQVLNGDFSLSPDWFTHWHLPAGRQMSYDDAVKSWPLREKKEFPKLINEYREREELVSPWRGYSRYLGWMDHKEFGEKAPALRVTLSSRWGMGKSTSLACAPIYLEKGRYRFSGRFRFDGKVDQGSMIFFYLIPEGEKRTQALFPLNKEGVFKVGTYYPQSFFTALQGQIRPWRKKMWKEFEFTFDSKGPAILDCRVSLKLNNKFTEAHAHVDDFKFERIEK